MIQHDFIALLQRFPSLRTLGLHRAYKHLNFGAKKPWLPDAHQDQKVHPVLTADAGMRWYANRIVQLVPSVDALYIHEEGFRHGTYGPSWSAEGWLTAQDAPYNGCRDAIGMLSLSPNLRSQASRSSI